MLQTRILIFILPAMAGGLVLLNIHAKGQAKTTAATPMLSKRKGAPPRLVLHLINRTPTVQLGEYPKVENRGKTAVRLIEPGEGSYYGWRTPIIGWSVEPVNAPRSEKRPPF